MPAVTFDHEKLTVYQESLLFCGWVGDLLEKLQGKASVKDQLDRASTSIPLNIAEGNAKFSMRDRSRFLEIAAGSALECAACLDVMVIRNLVTTDSINQQKERLVTIVQMLMGLLRRFSPSAESILREEPSMGL
ncbi:MAG: four helix bundle protein [Verrucomicrobiota bacterium]